MRRGAIGLALTAAVGLTIATETTGDTRFVYLAGCCVVLTVAGLLPQAGMAARALTALSVALACLTVWTDGGVLDRLAGPLMAAGFIAAFFSVVAALRDAALTSPSLERCGHYLAEQPPGRRYLMLTIGGHLFSLLLSYGAMSLLGTVAERVARSEPDPLIRRVRTRRMLIAIQRGLVATLCWSPVAFPMALATTLVAGADWGLVAPYCIVAGLLLLTLGWALDTAYKPVPRSRPSTTFRMPRSGGWRNLTPLVILLCTVLLPLAAIQALAGVRAVAAAMILVPPLWLGWVAIQNGGGSTGLTAALRRGVSYITVELPGYGNELVILTTAGFIGSLGAGLAGPLIQSAGIDFASVSAPILLISIVWLFPIAGQIGMNPILGVSLIGPLLPQAASVGLSPAAFVLALTSGWALSAASSPFTATTLLLGRLGGVTARQVGMRWNGAYTILGGMLLSAWILILLAAGAFD